MLNGWAGSVSITVPPAALTVELTRTPLRNRITVEPATIPPMSISGNRIRVAEVMSSDRVGSFDGP